MHADDWPRLIDQLVERLQTRYDFIGRKTGAPFLAILYPPESEQDVLREWQVQADSLRPEFDVLFIDALKVANDELGASGAEDVITQIADPWPGSDPVAELGERWALSVAREARAVLERREPSSTGKPVISVERLAALYPASGPQNVMRHVYDLPEAEIKAPVVFWIPGRALGPKSYDFFGRDELMYRGDMIY